MKTPPKHTVSAISSEHLHGFVALVLIVLDGKHERLWMNMFFLFNLRTLLPSNFLVPHIPDLHIPRGWGTIEMLIPSILLTMCCIAHHTMPRIHPGLLEAKPGLPTWVGCWMRWVRVSYDHILASHAPISCMHACSFHNYAKEHKAWSTVNVKDTTFPQGISSSFMVFDIDTCCTVSSTRYTFCCHTRPREEFNELEILSPRNGMDRL